MLDDELKKLFNTSDVKLHQNYNIKLEIAFGAVEAMNKSSVCGIGSGFVTCFSL